MKKLLLTAFTIGAFFFTTKSEAQVRVSLNFNVGRPSWGLSAGNQVGDYYYMPEIDSYYDIPHKQFVYLDHNRWVNASSLPYWLNGYDLSRGYKVAVNEPRP